MRSKPDLRGETMATNLLSHKLHKDSAATSYGRHHSMDKDPLLLYRDTNEHILRQNVEFCNVETGAH